MQNISVPITGMTGEMVACWGGRCYGDLAKDHVTCFRGYGRHARGQSAGACPAEPVRCVRLRLFRRRHRPTRSSDLGLMTAPEVGRDGGP